MTYQLIRGDATSIPLEDDSVDLVVTSPPYFALRSYTDGGEHYDGQIGSEATPAEFLDALLAFTAECRRVLKPSGSMFVNLGDKYVGGGQGGNVGGNLKSSNDRVNAETARRTYGMPTKSLMMLPQRYAIGCIDQLGLILRANIIWCLSGGARVYARINGKPRPVMLRDLVRSYQPENVELWNGDKWTQVLGWNRSHDTDGALELELRSGERIGCTPGHQWPTSRGLLRADEIRVGDIIDTCHLPDASGHHDALDDHDIGWFVGMYLAEGSRSGTVLQFAGHVNETFRHERLARIAAAYDGTCHVYQTGENTATCNLSGSILAGIIDRYLSGDTAKNKRLTMHAWSRSDAFLSGVMDGYLEGDGHHDAKNNRHRLGFTANDELAADLRTLAARLGASLTLKRCVHRGSYGDHPGWRGEWRWCVPTHANAKPRSEVVAIRASRARQFFDVGVADEPHLFALASGVLTHNSKPNGLPESVTDRVRRSHEDWFHLVKSPRYFTGVDEIREPTEDIGRKPKTVAAGPLIGNHGSSGHDGKGMRMDEVYNNPLGKLPGSVWTVPTEPLRLPFMAWYPPGGMRWTGTTDKGDRERLARMWRMAEVAANEGRPFMVQAPDHFAAFPSEWPRRLILGWSPSGICVECGQGRRPVVDKQVDQDVLARMVAGRGRSARDAVQVGKPGAEMALSGAAYANGAVSHSITGYACDCPQPDAPTRPAVVLDPFVGTGTTVAVAHHLGRHGIGIDLSADYLRVAHWRCNDPRLRAKVLRVDPPKPEIDGQVPLFGAVAS